MADANDSSICSDKNTNKQNQSVNSAPLFRRQVSLSCKYPMADGSFSKQIRQMSHSQQPIKHSTRCRCFCCSIRALCYAKLHTILETCQQCWAAMPNCLRLNNDVSDSPPTAVSVIRHPSFQAEQSLFRTNKTDKKHHNLVYFNVKDLIENNAKPTFEWKHQFEEQKELFLCNSHSKFCLHSQNLQQTFEFQYFELRKNTKGELRKVRFERQINTVKYKINAIREVKPNVYLFNYIKAFNNTIEEDPLFKHFIIDASKDEQSATVHQISLPFDNDPENLKMHKDYPYFQAFFIDLEELWIFRIAFLQNNYNTVYTPLHYVWRKTYGHIHKEELTHLKTDLINNLSAPQFLLFYNVQIEKETKSSKDLVLHFTTPFTLREVSMFFLLTSTKISMRIC